jgi:hypothetical protein
MLFMSFKNTDIELLLITDYISRNFYDLKSGEKSSKNIEVPWSQLHRSLTFEL